MKQDLTRVPLSALWPPLALLALAVALTLGSAWLGYDWLTGAFALGAAILIFDIRGRAQDFRNALYHLGQGRDPARIAKSYQYSWCGRVACLKAAELAGQQPSQAVERYYAENGYRWFHIFPDKTFSRDCPFLTRKFWEVTLRGNAHAKRKLEQLEAEEALGGASPIMVEAVVMDKVA